jgi:hypothetical protein
MPLCGQTGQGGSTPVSVRRSVNCQAAVDSATSMRTTGGLVDGGRRCWPMARFVGWVSRSRQTRQGEFVYELRDGRFNCLHRVGHPRVALLGRGHEWREGPPSQGVRFIRRQAANSTATGSERGPSK